MTLSKLQILTLLNLKRLGRVTAFALGKYARARRMDINTNKDMLDFINICREKNIARGLKNYALLDIERAKEEASNIVDISHKKDIGMISFFDKEYPEQLRIITKHGKNTSPILLYYKGDISRLVSMSGIAIVGTRKPTKEGEVVSEMLGEEFAKRKINIISGLAIGCDTYAHKGALKAPEGITTAFLAHGLDMVYPKSNENLAREVNEKGGLLISEYAVGTILKPAYLVERDRLQSGLADAIIVIQTSLEGGTYHAVNTALENNKPLFAVKYKSSALRNHEEVQGNWDLIDNGHALPLTNNNIDSVIELITKNKR